MEPCQTEPGIENVDSGSHAGYDCETPMETGERILALRLALGLTQESVADKSDGSIRRADMPKAEKGQNAAKTDRWRKGLATAFGLTRDDVADYLEGRLSLEEAVRRCGTKPAAMATGTSFPNRDRAIASARAEGLEKDDPAAFAAAAHSLTDMVFLSGEDRDYSWWRMQFSLSFDRARSSDPSPKLPGTPIKMKKSARP
jgi:transcriptional regulator with XRE-family HTH domain